MTKTKNTFSMTERTLLRLERWERIERSRALVLVDEGLITIEKKYIELDNGDFKYPFGKVGAAFLEYVEFTDKGHETYQTIFNDRMKDYKNWSKKDKKDPPQVYPNEEQILCTDVQINYMINFGLRDRLVLANQLTGMEDENYQEYLENEKSETDFLKEIKASLLTVLVAAAFIPFTLAEAQTPDQVLRAGLLDLKMSGAEGSLQVAEMFAECHGFQLALFAHLTSKVNIKIDDSDFATQIANQAMIDGHMAFLSSLNNTPDPEEYVNKISDAERAHWKDLINKPGKKDPLVWERLTLCQKIAPMSQYFVKEMRRKKNVSDSE